MAYRVDMKKGKRKIKERDVVRCREKEREREHPIQSDDLFIGRRNCTRSDTAAGGSFKKKKE